MGQEYEDAYYEQGDGPEFNRDCWISVKPNIPLAFPNLPYLLHGDDFHVSQSNAIIMYFAGEKLEEGVRVDHS